MKHSFSWIFLQHFKLLVRNDVDEKVEDLRVVDAGVDIAFLDKVLST